MKKKLLPLAMLAGLAGAAGTAQAAYVSPQGMGEGLVYPFYSVEGGQDTYINVVNTTQYTKAVKVRFLEAMNSAEVLDFNLYLSPEDHWSGVVTMTEDGAMLKTGDTSCTIPAIPAEGVEFRNYEYTGNSTSSSEGDGGPTGLERTREGYVEIIEMGIIEDDYDVNGDGNITLADDGVFGAEAAILHGSNGMPANCDLLRAAFVADGAVGTGFAAGLTGTGEWTSTLPGNIDNNFVDIDDTAVSVDASPAVTYDEAYLLAASGGLYGYGTLINVMEGTMATYSATALDEVFTQAGALTQGMPNHQLPGSTLPNFGQALPDSVILDGNTATPFASASLSASDAGWDAVSAVLMHAEISNDYVMEPLLAAGTDWVVTMPTKRSYVNGVTSDLDGNAATDATIDARMPFLNPWTASDSGAGACEEIDVFHWDREEQTPGVDPDTGDFDFSPAPPPPTVEVQGFALCSEANVITFVGPEGEIGGEGYTYTLYPSERVAYGFQTEFNNGWARLDLRTGTKYDSDGSGTAADDVLRTLEGTTVELYGLPTVGFAVQKYVNGTLNEGATLSNYAGLIDHKTEIDSATP